VQERDGKKLPSKQSEQKAAVEIIRGGFWRKSRVRSLCNT
jgi:hypothetical protein